MIHPIADRQLVGQEQMGLGAAEGGLVDIRLGMLNPLVNPGSTVLRGAHQTASQSQYRATHAYLLVFLPNDGYFKTAFVFDLTDWRHTDDDGSVLREVGEEEIRLQPLWIISSACRLAKCKAPLATHNFRLRHTQLHQRSRDLLHWAGFFPRTVRSGLCVFGASRCIPGEKQAAIRVPDIPIRTSTWSRRGRVS